VNHCFNLVVAECFLEFVALEQIALDKVSAVDDCLSMTFGKIVVDHYLVAVAY
jgi:hypothetical protein